MSKIEIKQSVVNTEELQLADVKFSEFTPVTTLAGADQLVGLHVGNNSITTVSDVQLFCLAGNSNVPDAILDSLSAGANIVISQPGGPGTSVEIAAATGPEAFIGTFNCQSQSNFTFPFSSTSAVPLVFTPTDITAQNFTSNGNGSFTYTGASPSTFYIYASVSCGVGSTLTSNTYNLFIFKTPFTAIAEQDFTALAQNGVLNQYTAVPIAGTYDVNPGDTLQLFIQNPGNTSLSLEITSIAFLAVNFSGTNPLTVDLQTAYTQGNGTILETNGKPVVFEDSSATAPSSNSSLFDVLSTTHGSRPFPFGTTAQRNAISSPAQGLFFYATDIPALCQYDGTQWRVVNGTLQGMSPLFVASGNVDYTLTNPMPVVIQGNFSGSGHVVTLPPFLTSSSADYSQMPFVIALPTSQAFTVNTNSGAAIVTVQPGQAYQLVLTDNSTSGGTFAPSIPFVTTANGKIGAINIALQDAYAAGSNITLTGSDLVVANLSASEMFRIGQNAVTYKGYPQTRLITSSDVTIDVSFSGTIATCDDLGNRSLTLLAGSTFPTNSECRISAGQVSAFTLTVNPSVTINGTLGGSFALSAPGQAMILRRLASATLTDVYVLYYLYEWNTATYLTVANQLSELAAAPDVARGNLGLPADFLICNLAQNYTLSNPTPNEIYINIPSPGFNINLPPLGVAGALNPGDEVRITVAATSSSVTIRNAASVSVGVISAPSAWILTPVPVSISPNGWRLEQILATGVTSITGTANQVIASASSGAVTLSLPQNIATTSTPIFAGFHDLNNNNMLSFLAIPAATNYIQIENSTAAPAISALGSSANIPLAFATTGSGSFLFDAATTTPIQISSGAGYQHFTSFQFADTSAARVVTFPDASGTVAFTSNIPSFPLSLANGGTDASLIANSGSLVYSTASALALLPTLPFAGLVTDSSGVPELVTATGVGAPVLAQLPTLVAPFLGIPSEGILTNCTGLPLATGVVGNLPVSNLNSGTGANNTTFWRGDGQWATAGSSGGVVDSVSGTPGFITTAGTANVVINIDSTYAGQSSIQTIGTLSNPASVAINIIAPVNTSYHYYFNGVGLIAPTDGSNIYGLGLTSMNVNPQANTSVISGTYVNMIVNVSAGVTVTNAYGHYVSPISGGGGGGLTNAKSMYLSAPTFGSTKWSLHAAGISEFDANVGIGAYPNYALDVTLSSTTAIILANISGSLSTPSAGKLTALNLTPTFAPNGSLNFAYAEYINPTINVLSASTLSNAYGIYVDAFVNAGSGTITNAKSMYLAAPALGTNKWSLHAVGVSEFDANVGIGAYPNYPLDVTLAAGSASVLANFSGTITATTASNSIGVRGYPAFNSAVTGTNVISLYTNATLNIPSGITYSTAYGHYIDAIANASAGQVTYAYGLYVNAPTASNSVQRNYAAVFTGITGIGTTTPAAALDIQLTLGANIASRLLNLTGSISNINGVTMYGAYINPQIAALSTISPYLATVYVSNNFAISTSVNTANVYGTLIDVGAKTGAGSIVRAINLAVKSPTYAATNVAAEIYGATSIIDSATSIQNPTSLFNVYEDTSNTDVSTGQTIRQYGAGNAVLNYDISGVAHWYVGVANNNAQAYQISNGAALNTGYAFRIDTSGRITTPLNPAFTLVKTVQANATGNAISLTITGTTQSNYGSLINAGTGVVTAPVTGNYLFSGVIALGNLGSANTGGNVSITTTAAVGNIVLNSASPSAARDNLNRFIFPINLPVYMTAGQTLSFQVQVIGGTQTVSVSANIGGFLIG